MKTTQACTLLAALWIGAASAGAHAAPPEQDTRLYVGAGIGRSSFSLPASNAPVPWGGEKGSKAGTAYKMYGGYRLTEYFGVEGGYARLGSVSQWASLGGLPTLQKGSGQVFYAAATAHLPLGESFALNGRLGVAHGKVSGGDNRWLLPNQSIAGSATGLMAGFGAEYRMSRDVSLTADYDYFGKLSKQAKGGMLTVGLRANF